MTEDIKSGDIFPCGTTYRGISLTYLEREKVVVLGKICNNLREVDEVINNACKIIEKSILNK